VSDDDTIDPNQVRRHQKRMLSEFDYRKKYSRIDFYRPNRAQEKFHALKNREKAVRAGNQQGKTHCAAFEMASHALARYPDWWQGIEFIVPPLIERPVDFMGWASCTTSMKVRDGAQLKLLGPVREEGGLGTGMIPLDVLTTGRVTMARGIADFVDTVSFKRDNGGMAQIQFKTYEMGREAYQGTPVDVNWLDEDISKTDDAIYGECLARKVTTRGIIICSLSPLLGMSPLRKRFKERNGFECAEVLMTIDDCRISNGGHIPDEEVPGIIASFKANEVATRVYGADMQGEGAVFGTPADRIRHTRDPATFPGYWPWLWGFDFRHSGSDAGGHPFAAVLGCWDRDNDIIYIVHAVRLLGRAPDHVAAIKKNPMWDAPVAWPHDGGRAASLLSGETVAAVYKKLGMAMRSTHACFPGGNFKFENGIDEMDRRFATGRLLVASHLAEWFDEYMGYHRDGGLVVKVDDDLMSATRQLVMDIRYAKTAADFHYAARVRRDGVTNSVMCQNVDFDVFA